MSKDTMAEMDALMGGGTTGDEAEKPTVAQDVFDKTNHELEVARGRLKSLDARMKELEKENAALKATKARTDIVSAALSDEERQNLDPTFLDAAAKIAAASAESVRHEYEERERARQEQDERRRAEEVERARDAFARRVEEAHPGFFASVGAGGANNAQWKEFMSTYGASVNAAWQTLNFDAMSRLVDQFQSSLGIRVPSGSQGRATSPDPRNLGSGAPVVQHGGPNKVYTAEEYAALEKQAEQLRRRGEWDNYRRLNDELNNILAEGRVKD